MVPPPQPVRWACREGCGWTELGVQEESRGEEQTFGLDIEQWGKERE